MGRYYCKSGWKKLTSEEAKTISDAGLYIVAVYEDNPTYPGYFSRRQGSDDCWEAVAQAEAIGQPYDTAIYFAVDFDAYGEECMDGVVQYFEGVADAMKCYRDANGGGCKLGV